MLEKLKICFGKQTTGFYKINWTFIKFGIIFLLLYFLILGCQKKRKKTLKLIWEFRHPND